MRNPAWEENYRRGRYNRYPYDAIVSFVMRAFAGAEDRSQIRVLDLGCGGGNNLRFIQEQGFEFRAIDGAPESIRLTKEYLGLATDDPRVVLGDFTDLPHEASTFDAVLDRASLACNLSPDISRIVAEIHRVLKPGGYYFGVDLCSEDHPDLRHGRHLGGGDYNGFSDGSFVAARQIHGFSIAELLQTFNKFVDLEVSRHLVEKAAGGEALTISISYNVSARKP